MKIKKALSVLYILFAFIQFAFSDGYNDIAYTYFGSQDNVTILFNDGSGKFIEDPLTSIKYLESQNIDVEVFPNPFKDHTTITFTLPESSELSVNIFDQLGKKVQEIQNKWYEKGKQSFDIDTPDLSPGVYYFELLANNQRDNSQKLMIFN